MKQSVVGRLENHIDFIKDEILIQIESAKDELDKLNDNLVTELDKMKIHILEYII